MINLVLCSDVDLDRFPQNCGGCFVNRLPTTMADGQWAVRPCLVQLSADLVAAAKARGERYLALVIDELEPSLSASRARSTTFAMIGVEKLWRQQQLSGAAYCSHDFAHALPFQALRPTESNRMCVRVVAESGSSPARGHMRIQVHATRCDKVVRDVFDTMRLTLASDDCQSLFPSNTPSDFIVRLPHSLPRPETGGMEPSWEVALLSMAPPTGQVCVLDELADSSRSYIRVSGGGGGDRTKEKNETNIFPLCSFEWQDACIPSILRALSPAPTSAISPSLLTISTLSLHILTRKWRNVCRS